MGFTMTPAQVNEQRQLAKIADPRTQAHGFSINDLIETTEHDPNFGFGPGEEGVIVGFEERGDDEHRYTAIMVCLYTDRDGGEITEPQEIHPTYLRPRLS